MTAPTISVPKKVSFRCAACSSPAQITVDDDEPPPPIIRVFCPECCSEVAGAEAHEMYLDLVRKSVIQEGRNIARQRLNESGLGRLPLQKVDTEFSDERWPFALLATDPDGL